MVQIITALMSLSLIAFSAQADSEIGKMHSAYQSGNIKEMVVSLRKVLEENPEDPLVKANALGLLKKAYASQGDAGVPCDWQLPNEILNLKVAVKRNMRDEAKYALRIQGGTVAAKMIDQIVLTHTGQSVIDKKAGLGDYEEDETQGGHTFTASSKRMLHGFETGLYLLRIVLTNGKLVDGWFIVDEDMNTTTSPEVLSPANGETITSTMPTLKWKNYVSSQYKPFEHRTLWVGVGKNLPPNYQWEEKFERSYNSPSSRDEQVTIPTPLEPGEYEATFNYREFHRFGDIQIGRVSATVRPFKIK